MRLHLRGTSSTTCPFCKDGLVGPRARCDTCAAEHHADCWAAHGACSACGHATASGEEACADCAALPLERCRAHRIEHLEQELPILTAIAGAGLLGTLALVGLGGWGLDWVFVHANHALAHLAVLALTVLLLSAPLMLLAGGNGVLETQRELRRLRAEPPESEE